MRKTISSSLNRRKLLISVLMLNPILKDSYMHYLKRKCEKLGIPITNNHAFRVAFNARLIAAGIDGNDRCLVLGHSMQTNERNYSFSDKRKANDIRDKLNSLAL